MNKKLIIAILLALSLLLLTACGNTVKSGTVVEKTIYPPHVITTYINVYDIMIPMPRNVPAKYSVTLSNEYGTGEIYMSRADYERINIGDYLSFEQEDEYGHNSEIY